MKQVLLFLIPVILFSCNGPGQDSKLPDSIGGIPTKDATKAVNAGDALKSIILANVHKQPVVDSIFLGFMFSMTENKVLIYFNRLIKEKKLVMNSKDQRQEYPMAFDLVKANASIAPEFHDDKLYKLSLVIEPADDMGTAQTIYYQTATTYMKKYNNSGYTFFEEPDLAYPEAKRMHWVKNNLHIALNKNSSGCVVSYINTLAEELINKSNSVTADSAKTQTKKDI